MSTIIQYTLKDLNDQIFFKKDLFLVLLKECPDMIPILADWSYKQWISYDHNLTQEKLILSLQNRLSDDHLPFTLVALNHAKCPVGTISLKEKEEPEFADLQDGTPWGGSLYVIEEYRKKELGKDLARALVTIAKNLRYPTLFFYTSNEKSVNWYLKLGAQLIDKRPFRNHIVTIMLFPLNE